MKTLLIRAASALVALLLLAAVIYFFGSTGVLVLVSIAMLLGIREGSVLLFPDSQVESWALTFGAAFLFLFGIFIFDFVGLALILMFVCLFPLLFAIQGEKASLDELLQAQGRMLLGLVYMGLLPLFACHLLNLNNGMIWFLALLAFVFAGDTFAYLVGWKFGKHLLLPSVSPKKTKEGSIGGILGSGIAGGLMHFALPHVPWYYLIPLAILVGALGQVGDLFESLLKRTANKKDSGAIMPGHGGFLDRVDGVLFGAPMLFVAASFFEKWF